jgi:hypothetical protein
MVISNMEGEVKVLMVGVRKGAKYFLKPARGHSCPFVSIRGQFSDPAVKRYG